MKLELKHLAPYLPYGLKAIYNFENEENEIVSITGTSLFSNEMHYQLMFKDGKTIGLFKDDFKPILRPLSDLTKEIEHFVNEMGGEVDFIEDDCGIWQVSEEPVGGLVTYKTFFEVYDPIEEMQEPTILINTLSDQDNKSRSEGSRLLTYYEMNYLISKHFDVFGLIEKGLAIDKNRNNEKTTPNSSSLSMGTTPSCNSIPFWKLRHRPFNR